MNRIAKSCAAGIAFISAAFTTSSCIFGGIDEEYIYKTSWESDQEPFAPLPVTKLAIAFDCNCTITIDMESGSREYFAIYSCNHTDAYFQNLTIPIDDTSVTMIDCTRTDAILTLRWRLDSDMSQHTTQLQLVKDRD